jgi:ferredoxin
VIVIGRRILRGSLRGVEEGTNFGSTYRYFGYTWLEDNFLAQTTYDLTCWIEAQGWEAVPLFGYSADGMPTGRPVAQGKPAPNVYVDVEHAAQAAGLGEVGLGGFFLTPQFGPRQRFAMILTDADPAPDPVPELRMCGSCRACAVACPFGAIDVEHTSLVGVAGHECTVAALDYEICRSCPNGMQVAGGRGDRPDRLAAACARECVVKLEAAGKCKNTFREPFRKRTPWRLDVLKRPITSGQAARNAASLGCGDATANQER